MLSFANAFETPILNSLSNSQRELIVNRILYIFLPASKVTYSICFHSPYDSVVALGVVAVAYVGLPTTLIDALKPIAPSTSSGPIL